ncbi:hypothetical protein JB92DRAFT_3001543 [Gautieria morchelliformis]|nr:hypothetical protein JB92DRAFT_3001543 [Gautieria morchelliformis]
MITGMAALLVGSALVGASGALNAIGRLLSFTSIVLTELFGSPFLKNISILVGLAAGSIIAGANGYINGSTIRATPAITFLWYAASNYYKVWSKATVRVYAPAVLPMLGRIL